MQVVWTSKLLLPHFQHNHPIFVTLSVLLCKRKGIRSEKKLVSLINEGFSRTNKKLEQQQRNSKNEGNKVHLESIVKRGSGKGIF